MDNNNLFKALSSKSRIKIIKILKDKEIHLSELARTINLSKPVVFRHVKILEKAGLIKRKIIGNVHLLSINLEKLEKSFESFTEEKRVDAEKNSTIFDALKQIPGVKTKDYGKNKYITSIDGEKGYYIYEVNGKIPDIPIDKFKPKKDVTVNLKKLVPIEKKKIKIHIKKDKEK